MSIITELEGTRYGQLTVLRDAEPFVQPSGQRARAVLCRCDCGREKRLRLSHIRHGRIQSCGCLVREKHGESTSPLYTTWRGMRNRCTQNYSQAHIYHARGITVCAEWQDSFDAFKVWALANGYAPGLTIDRRDNSKGYTPDNCRFVTQRENCNNRRNTVMIDYNGAPVSLSLLLHEKGLSSHYTAINNRIQRGWSPQLAVDTHIRAGNYGKKLKR